MAETIELLPLEKSKSPVWLYFGFPAQGVFLEKEKKRGPQSTANCADKVVIQR